MHGYVCKRNRMHLHTGVKYYDREKNIVNKLLEKYKNLRYDDKMNLIKDQLKNIKERDIKVIYDFTVGCVEGQGLNKEHDATQDTVQNKRKSKLMKLRKPSFVQEKRGKKRINNDITMMDIYEERTSLEKEKELKHIEKYTLIEDLYKSYIYSKAFTLLNSQYRTKHSISNSFIHIMINTLRKHILDKVKPTLINEFAVYTNPYMLFKNALFNFILHQYVKNPYEESLIESYMNRKINLTVLKINSADVPVEVYEPLVSFRGDIHYSYDFKEKFKESITTSLKILSAIMKNATNENKHQDKKECPHEKWQHSSTGKELLNDGSSYEHADMKDGEKKMYKDKNTTGFINEILKILPENTKYYYDNYPFYNLKSFKTNIQKKYVGGIKNSKPINTEEEELSYMRYPTLQCVAHSLPKDIKYRNNVVHTIKVLERSKYWDYTSKIKAINTLIDVWNNMHSSEHYENLLDKSLPVIYSKDMLRKTRTRKETYNQGITYIQSLTTQKPLHMRTKKG
ncbi:hypothetical protein MKS88_003306 [Plasmodium brasilianum]|uniref:Uncharacterized protein n=2 Tax=Plasmodium (Plasmodium) TaxID=418103 RepID=A0A1A8WWN6_PLAMA|nr:conserved Plasmodium protein, unknown function [Plasmodium malariae]KAI4837887.1 hypothetical protein MKS88_003306 [Plasmodium brasilianum]SBS95749.1 conserved Plasmodium protein, unknown function [Plasmodium malariae]SCN45020.1 conserved Plasmodium protein, unknown function [Plasmodium malariae]